MDTLLFFCFSSVETLLIICALVIIGEGEFDDYSNKFREVMVFFSLERFLAGTRGVWTFEFSLLRR